MARAIPDIQGSIHANDSKSAAGLVVQGLLATAVVTLASKLGSIYAHGTAATHTIVKATLLGALLLAVASIMCMIMALRPYSPKRLNREIGGHSQGVFFPDIRHLRESGPNAHKRLRPSFEALADAALLDDEYLFELLKVADIRYTLDPMERRLFGA